MAAAALEEELRSKLSSAESDLSTLKEAQHHAGLESGEREAVLQAKLDQAELLLTQEAGSRKRTSDQLASVQSLVASSFVSIQCDLQAALSQASHLEEGVTFSNQELLSVESQLGSCKQVMAAQSETLALLESSQTGLAEAGQRQAELLQELQACREELAAAGAWRESLLGQVLELHAYVESVKEEVAGGGITVNAGGNFAASTQ